jgi:hypothetical protein
MLHVFNEETIVCEIDRLPEASDQFIMIYNPRRRDGKPLPTLADGATSYAFPWARIAFVEFFEEAQARESIIGLFRESDGRRHG